MPGGGELERGAREAIEQVERNATVRCPATFTALLDELATASHFIGNDSGPAHLAGIIGVPTIALFGTPSHRWRPIGPRVRVMEKRSLEQITVDDVLALL